MKVKMASNPKFFFRNFTGDIVDDEDDCIICGKLLLNHSEQQANECYATLMKMKLCRRELAQKGMEGT